MNITFDNVSFKYIEKKILDNASFSINDNDKVEDLHLALGDGILDYQAFAEYYKKYMKGASILLEMKGPEKQKKSLEKVLDMGLDK